MAIKYGTITTNACDAAIAQFAGGGPQVLFAELAVGDSGGTYYEPSKTQTTLRGEKWRGPCSVSYDPANKKRVVVTANIPATVGGFQVREAAVFDKTNVLMLASKQPLSDKVSPDSGASKDMTIRLYAEVVDQQAVEIVVDPSADNVTRIEFRGHVDDTNLHTSAAEKQVISDHVGNKIVHVTADDKVSWAGKAKVVRFALALPASSWAGTSAPYTQTLAAPGILATDRPHLGITHSGTAAQQVQQTISGGFITKLESAADSVTFTAQLAKPMVDLQLFLEVVR